MNAKEAKKIRKLFRKTAEQEAKEMGKIIGNAMKPKPKFIPMRLWLWGAGLFIKIKK